MIQPPEQEDVPETLGAAIREGATEGLAKAARHSLRAAVIGAVLGAVALGGVAVWLFGFQALLYGAGAGAVLGAVGVWLLYLQFATA